MPSAISGEPKTSQNLADYVAHFSDNARVIFQQFDFTNTCNRLSKAGLLFKICRNFSEIDLHPDEVPDRVMSNIYEHLIRRFGAEVNEGAEDFMTPRDVVRLATTLLLDPDDALFESEPVLSVQSMTLQAVLAAFFQTPWTMLQIMAITQRYRPCLSLMVRNWNRKHMLSA
jgi:hypothetical protein